jgi:hypothetical protein
MDTISYTGSSLNIENISLKFHTIAKEKKVVYFLIIIINIL